LLAVIVYVEKVVPYVPLAVRALVIDGGEPLAVIVKVCVLEADAAPVVVTPTFTVPEDAISAAEIVAVNCVADTNVVVRLAPPHVTVDNPLIKLVPLTLMVNPEPPAVADDGEMEVVVGVGLSGADADVSATVRSWIFPVPAPAALYADILILRIVLLVLPGAGIVAVFDEAPVPRPVTVPLVAFANVGEDP